MPGYAIALFLGFAALGCFPFIAGLELGWLSYALMPVFLLAFFSRSVISMAGVMALSLGLRAYMGEPYIFLYAMSFMLGWACYAALVHLRCPRCKTSLVTTWSNWNGRDYRPYCPACGRITERVWPFQHSRNPEAWDGEYHDEGGGPQTDAAISQTKEARERWERRQARQSKPRA